MNHRPTEECRARLSEYGYNGDVIDVAGRRWMAWIDDVRINAAAMTEADELLCANGTILRGVTTARREGKGIADHIRELAQRFYGGLAEGSR